MKPDTYDTIINTTKELCGYGGWFLLVASLGACILAIVYLTAVEGFDIPLSITYLVIIDLVISFLIIIFVFMIKKTQERFDVKNWRDFWMAFGYPVEILFDGITEKEIKNWLDENTPRLYRILERNSSSRLNMRTVVFRHKRDAMACKLKWS